MGLSPPVLARCAMTRTPYSALVENITGSNPTYVVGESPGPVLEQAQVVGQALGGRLGDRIAHALAPARVHQRDVGDVLLGHALGRDAVALPQRPQLRPRPEHEADAARG